MSDSVVRFEVDEGVGVITLNRPERRNALHPDMYREIPAAIESFNSDDSVGCILITGAGTAFCAGGDIRDGGKRAGDSLPADPAAALASNARMVQLLHESPKLTLAALPGPAVGAGLGIALSTDLRIMAESATLVTGWTSLGFSGDFGGGWFLTRLIGPSRALELLVDNRPVTAAEAKALGLANRVVADGELPEEARRWAMRLAAGPRTAHRFIKENIEDALRLPLAGAIAAESARMVASSQTEEHRAAVRAWLERAKAKRAKADAD
jgi:2-(1,2-epoxy-1,2-dihydrophenyl)acetyl-CoA isomerase